MSDLYVSLPTAGGLMAGAVLGGLMTMYGIDRFRSEGRQIEADKLDSSKPVSEKMTGRSAITYFTLVTGLVLIIVMAFLLYYLSTK